MDVRQLAFLARQPSAAIQPRERFWGISKRGLAFVLANALFWQPLWAQAGGITVSGQGTTTTAAANGVPIVNIAAPNASGLSHNQFGDYNVGSQGLILNNATGSTQSTQLGGIILGNSNLKGQAASTILNEVTGTNRSQLNGYTEVAGQAAHVIVANPYGITCNGCGFINTPRATLTTGKPVLDANGKLDHYQVDGGDVAIDGAGINAGNVDSFEVITRSARINGQINANQLTLVAGRNDVDATTLNATARADDGSAKPSLAIDSTALGGMYAGAIKLVGTEKGVGVNLAGNLAASAGDIELDANGQLNVAQVAASGAVRANAQSVTTSGPVYAGSHLDVSTSGDLNNRQNLAARDAITLSSGGQLNNSGIIEAGVNADNSRNTAGDVSVSAQNLTNSGSVVASRDLSVQAAQAINNQGHGLSAKGNLGISGQRLNNGPSGLVAAGGALTLNVAQIDNTGGTLQGATTTLHGDTLSNVSGVISATGKLTSTVDSINNQGGELSSQGDISLSGRQLDNTSGQVTSQGTLLLSVTGDVINSQGLLSSEGLLTASAASLSNRLGSLSSAGQLSLTTTGAVDNQDGKLVTDGGLDLHSASLDNSNQGTVSASQAMAITTGTLNNQHSGSISGGDALALAAGQVSNGDSGSIAAQNAVTASVTGLDQNGGKLFSHSALTLDLNHGALANQAGLINAPLLVLKNLAAVDNTGGEISSAQAFTFDAASLTNDNGKLLSNQALAVTVNQALSNLNGTIAAASLHVQAASLNNAGGTLNSQGDLKLAVSGQLTNNNLGLINATSNLAINAAAIDNSNGGNLLGSAIALDFGAATGDLDNASGLVTTTGQLTVNHLRDLNNQQGELSSSQNLTVAGRTLDNTGGKLISDNLLTLTASSLLNPGGLVSGWQGVSMTAGSLDNRNSGTVSSRYGDVTVTVQGDLLNGNSGALVSQGALNVSAGTLDNSAGILSSAAGLTLQAISLSNNAGSIAAQNAFSFTGTTFDNSNGSVTSNGAATLGLLGVLTNTNGKLASGSDLLIQGATQVNNRNGQLASQTLLTLLTGGLDNSNGGTIAANDVLTVTATGAVQNSADGLIYSQHAGVTLHAASLANSRGTLQSQAALNVTTTGDIDNQSGTLLAQGGDLSVTAGNLDSRGGTLSSQSGAFIAQLTGVLKNGYDLTNASQKGNIQAQSLDLTSTGLDNDGGRIAAQTGDAVVSTGDFNNQNGGLYATGKVKVTAHNVDNSGAADGQIGAQQIDLSLSGALNNENGIVESDSTLSIAAASIDNRNGELRALGDGGQTRFILGGALDNRKGIIESANSDFSLGAGSFQNSGGTLLHLGAGTFDMSLPNVTGAGGSIVTRGGLTLNADTWANDSVIQAGRLTVNVNHFSQTGNGQLLASDTFTGTGGDWTNDGLIASSGGLGLNLTGNYAGHGRLSSVGALSLGAANIDIAGDASITAGTQGTVTSTGTLTNLGHLTSAGGLNVSAATLSNQGTLGSAADLRINAATLVNQNGLIFSGGDMALRTNDLTNRYADIYGLGNVSIAADDNNGWSASIVNISATLESGGDLSLAASHIENRKDVFETTGGLVSAEIGEQCYTCTTFGDYSDYKTDVYLVWVENYKSQIVADSASASMTAGNNFSVVGGDLTNSASSISAGKDITLGLQTFTNQGASVGDYTRRRSFSASGVGMRAVMDYNAANDPDYDSGALGRMGGDGGFNSPNLHVWNQDGVEALTRVRVRGGGPAPLIAYGGIWTDFGGGAYDFTAPHFDGTVSAQAPESVQNATFFEDTVTYANPSTYANAVVQAGGAVHISATQNLTNSVVREGVVLAADTSRVGATQVTATPAPTVVALNAQLPPDLARQQVDPLTLPGFSLPTGQNGLFRLSGQGAASNPTSSASQNWTIGAALVGDTQRQPQATHQSPTLDGPDTVSTAGTATIARVQGVPDTSTASKPQNYLIETNPALTSLKQFMSSDYMLSALGYNPDDSEKRLGDGLYEQTLVDQAVVARTGQRYIDGETSDAAQFKYLMDNGIAAQQTLNLTVGTALTADQVAALTHDIVWMQSEVVDGQTVLVPVVYLANANNRLAPTGALIAGSDMNLVAGQTISNVGTVAASNSLSALAGTDVVNSGLIQAGGRLDLLASNNVVNQSGGIIAGGDVSVTAVEGDVTNKRTLTSLDSDTAVGVLHKDYSDTAARIEAANGLTVSAGRDVSNQGSVLQSGGDISISAGRDVALTSTALTTSASAGANHTNSTIAQLGSTVTSGGDLTVQAGRDLSVVASQLSAKGDVAMAATGTLDISSAANETHSYSKGKHETRQEDHVHQVSSDVTAGNSITLQSGSDLTLESSHLTAGTDATVAAGGKLNVLAAQDTDYSLYDMTKKGSFGSKKTKHDEVTQVTNISSVLTTGGNLTLASNSDQLYQAAKLNSGNDLTISSGGAVTFEGVKDLHQETHTKSNSDLAWTSAKGKGSTDETLQQTEMTAKGKTVINAVNGLNIDVKQINQETVSQVIDTMVEADPSLSWIKDAEVRGDVNWQQVKEVHDAFKYSTHGLGAGAQIILAIAMTLAMGPAGLGLGTGSAEGAGALANTAVNSAISNNGNLGQVLKDTISVSSLKSAGVAMLTAGIGAELQFDPTALSTNTLVGASETALADAAVTTAIEGGSFGKNLASAAIGEGVAVAGATLANDISGSSIAGGKLTKVGLHALLGGVLSVAQGGNFATGALAAGGDEALVDAVADKFAPDIVTDTATPEQRAVQTSKLLAISQLIGVLAAGVANGNASVGAEVANNATQNNFLGPISAARRDADRAAVAKWTATVGEASELLTLESNDQYSDYLKQKVDNYETLTPTEAADWAAANEQYLREANESFGMTKGMAAYTGMLQNGVVQTYDYPFAGTAQQQAEWRAANADGLFGTLFHTESENERLYHDAQIIVSTDSSNAKLQAFSKAVMTLGIPGEGEVNLAVAIDDALGSFGLGSKVDALEVGNTGGSAGLQAEGSGNAGGAIVSEAAPYSPIVEGGGLQAYEGAGGHLLERHVDLTDADLAQRLATSNISSASRFADRSTAEAAVSAAVDANQATIQSYLASNTKGYLAIEYTSSTPVGSTLLRGASSTVPASEVRVVIARDPTMSTGYKIITGYPHL